MSVHHTDTRGFDVARDKTLEELEKLNTKIVNLGKRVDRLEKTNEKILKALEKLPEALVDSLVKVRSETTLDKISETLNEMNLAISDIQTVTNQLLDALTREVLEEVEKPESLKRKLVGD